MPNQNVIFTRAPRPSLWNPRELAGPYESLTLREWEMSITTCNQAPEHCALLRNYLLLPATSTCRELAPWLPRRPLPYPPDYLRQATLTWKREQLQRTLAAIWQTLDTPPYVLTGLARDFMLVLLSVRLRQLLDAFPGTPDALAPLEELKEALVALGFRAKPATTPPPAHVRDDILDWVQRWTQASFAE